MANNRYYIQCPVCKEEIFMGKSLGEGIYNNRGYSEKPEGDTSFLPTNQQWMDGDAKLLEELYAFMWKHMIECHKDEFKSNELFKIISEYKE